MWNAEEQEWVNHVEQGVVTPYNPSLTLESLVGYGPAIATDSNLGKVESAMRSMRILGGAMAFNSDGLRLEPTEYVKRYYQEKPVFFHSKQEKDWVEAAKPGVKFSPLSEATKTAIIDAAILGKYEAPQSIPVGNTLEAIKSYQIRNATVTAEDGDKFNQKMQSLLPASMLPKEASKSAGGSKKAAKAKAQA
jgi:hypothetical protein